jgi:hypothetical protein
MIEPIWIDLINYWLFDLMDDLLIYYELVDDILFKLTLYFEVLI